MFDTAGMTAAFLGAPHTETALRNQLHLARVTVLLPALPRISLLPERLDTIPGLVLHLLSNPYLTLGTETRRGLRPFQLRTSHFHGYLYREGGRSQ